MIDFKKLGGNKYYKGISYTLLISAFALFIYSIFTNQEMLVIIALSLLGISMLLGIPIGISEHFETRNKLKTDFDDIIELIKEGKLKHA